MINKVSQTMTLEGWLVRDGSDMTLYNRNPSPTAEEQTTPAGVMMTAELLAVSPRIKVVTKPYKCRITFEFKGNDE